jgi:hypothetical protein
MAAAELTLVLSTVVFTREDFVRAFNEWVQHTNEEPERMGVWMKQLKEHYHGDEGAACTEAIFSILHDLKEKNKNEHA